MMLGHSDQAEGSSKAELPENEAHNGQPSVLGDFTYIFVPIF